MGMFASLSGIIGKGHQQVEDSFRRYAVTHGGGLEQTIISGYYYDYSLIYQQGIHTTLLYPDHFFEWDDASAWLSKDLDTPVFSFHIHDGDFWMYCLFVNGQQIDQFNPIPNYWETLPEEEAEAWKGNPALLAVHIPGLNPAAIEEYLVSWNLDTDFREKAYVDDEYAQEDLQLIDFMRKLGFAWPVDDNNRSLGQAYKMWTKGHPFPDRPTPQNREFPAPPAPVASAWPTSTLAPETTPAPSSPSKPWWKLW